MFMVCSNNSIEVNLLEACEKEEFAFEKLDITTHETDSAAGRVAADLQTRTYKIFQRFR